MAEQFERDGTIKGEPHSPGVSSPYLNWNTNENILQCYYYFFKKKIKTVHIVEVKWKITLESRAFDTYNHLIYVFITYFIFSMITGEAVPSSHPLTAHHCYSHSEQRDRIKSRVQWHIGLFDDSGLWTEAVKLLITAGRAGHHKLVHHSPRLFCGSTCTACVLLKFWLAETYQNTVLCHCAGTDQEVS